MEGVRLTDGRMMPTPGFGTSLRVSDPQQRTYKAVREAIRAGYRHIDTAQQYCNEHEVGAAIRDEIIEGTIRREDMFITTKVVNFTTMIMSAEDIEDQVNQSLIKLQTDYVDLLLIHFPVAVVLVPPKDVRHTITDFIPKRGMKGSIVPLFDDYVDRYKVFEKLVSQGVVRSLGVSNFNEAQLRRLCSRVSIKPVCNQVEAHVFLQQDNLLSVCNELGIVMTAFAPLCSPGMPKHYNKSVKESLLSNGFICGIADRIQKTPAQVCLRYLVNKGIVPLPKSETPERIKSNFQISDVELSAEDMQKIADLNRNDRYMPFADLGPKVISHPDFPWPEDVLKEGDECAVRITFTGRTTSGS